MFTHTKTQTIRNKLAILLKKTQRARSDLDSLKTLHVQTFTFAALLPKQIKKILNSMAAVDKKPLTNMVDLALRNNSIAVVNRLEEDKENMKNQMNITNNTNILNSKQHSGMLFKKNYALKGKSMFESAEQVVSLDSLKNRDQIRDLKTNLWMQLTEIKNMEKQEAVLRRANEKMKEYNSEQKKNYRSSLSKDKSVSSCCSYKKINVESVYTQKTIKQSLESSQIQVNIPVTIQNHYIKSKPSESVVKALKCPNGHQYYQGGVNELDKPHGSGRIQFCCKETPMRNEKGDFQFYQGQFNNGDFHGFGTLCYKGGVKYVGQFKRGRRQGKGSLYHNGKAETAKWDNDRFVRIL